MSRFHYIQNSFSAGELGRKLDGRSDLDVYYKGARRIENMYPMPQGGVSKRPGTILLWDDNSNHLSQQNPYLVDRYSISFDPSSDGLRYDSNNSFTLDHEVLIPFVYNNSSFSLVSITSNFSGSESNDDYRIKNFYYDENNNFVVQEIPWNDSLTNLSNSLDPYGFNWKQVGRFLIICHSSGTIPPIVLTADETDAKGLYLETDTVNASWEYSSFAQGDGIVRAFMSRPYLPPNTTSITMQPGATTGNTTLTASSGYFTSDMVGTYFKVTHSSTTGVARVTAFTSATEVDITVIEDFGATTASTNWSEAAWSDYRGWPRYVGYSNRRLILANTKNSPSQFWASKTDNIFHFMARRLAQDASSDSSGINYFGDDGQDTDPFEHDTGSPIQWVSTQRSIFLGLEDREVIISPANNGVLSSNSKSQIDYSFEGSSSVKPVKAGSSVFFVGINQKKIFTSTFNFQSQGIRTEDVTSLNDNVASWGYDESSKSDSFHGAGFKRLAFQKSKSIIWAVTSKNKLIGFTYSKENGVAGWHKHEIAGNDVKVYDIAVIPNPEGDSDDLIMSLSRKVNGTTYYYLEKIGREFEHARLDNTSSNKEDLPYYLDSASTHLPRGVESMDHVIEVTNSAVGSSTQIEFSSSNYPSSVPFGLYAYKVKAGDGSTKAVTKLAAFNEVINNPNGIDLSDYFKESSYFVLHNGGDTAAKYFWFSDGSSTDPATQTTSLAGPRNPTDAGAFSNISSSADGVEIVLDYTNDTISDAIEKIKDAIDGESEWDAVSGESYYFENFAHLAGETLDSLVNGLRKEVTVDSNGIIELDKRASHLVVGHSYTPVLSLMRLEAGQNFGTAQGALKRIDEAIVRLYKSYLVKIGKDENSLRSYNFLNSTQPMGGPLEMVTGDTHPLKFNQGVTTNGYVVISQDGPFPLFVTSVILKGQTYEGA